MDRWEGVGGWMDGWIDLRGVGGWMGGWIDGGE